tara:strand:- start:3140 stop:3517 length:378 start_codon:yes stop_codon:yes gene_type:complete
MAKMRNKMEVELSEYQTNVFVEAENMLANQGNLGEKLFEDTYVIQKEMVTYVKNSISESGSETTIGMDAMAVYRHITGFFVNSDDDTRLFGDGGNTNTTSGGGQPTGGGGGGTGRGRGGSNIATL